MAQAQSSAKKADEQQLITLHAEFMQFYGNHDPRALDFYQRNALDPFVILHSGGQVEIVTLAQKLAHDRKEYEANPQRRVHTQVRDVKVHTFGDTAVVISRYTTQISVNEGGTENLSIDGNDMQTWVRDKTQWKIAAMSVVRNVSPAR